MAYLYIKVVCLIHVFVCVCVCTCICVCVDVYLCVFGRCGSSVVRGDKGGDDAVRADDGGRGGQLELSGRAGAAGAALAAARGLPEPPQDQAPIGTASSDQLRNGAGRCHSYTHL